jgi:Leucine-rich repeat (LRR) protein
LKPGGTLDLSSQNLTELDIEALSEFSASNDVRQLYLQQNSLTTIPSALAQLSHLTVLNLSQNSIEDPFREIVLLPKLKELRLPGNKLRSLEGLTTFLTAPHLQHLDVSHNRITGELPTLRLTFPELILLNASQNEISKVRAVSLRGLKIVNLSSNDISRLDPEIGLLAGSLTSLEVEGNTFRVPNFAVLRKGTDAVLAWLRDKIPEPVVEEGGAGASPAWIVE